VAGPSCEGLGASDDEKLVFCLVSNDKLISKVTIETDVLLDSVYRRDKKVAIAQHHAPPSRV